MGTYESLTGIALFVRRKAMKSGERPPVFPYKIIWEEIGSSIDVDWESLEFHRDEFEAMFTLAEQHRVAIPFVDRLMLNNLAKRVLKRRPSPLLVSQMYLLAGWQVTGEFRKLIGIDLKSQRSELKRLQVAASKFWEASNHVSGQVSVLLSWLHAIEPQGLLPHGEQLNLQDLSRGVYDVSLVAERAYEDTKSKKTGRVPEIRRDATVRLAAGAIEAETGEPITTSPGNSANSAPHFTNASGFFLRDFLKLVDPKTDERLLVQSLKRVRKN